MTRREVPSKSWCAKGDTQARCHAEHSYGALPAGPSGGKNRACPVCAGNLSVNPGDRGMWLVWCCQEGCDPGIVRLALEQAAGIAPECLGSYATEDWRAKQARHDAVRFPARPDSATLAAARRSYAYQQLIGAQLAHASLLRMCMQAIAESDGGVTGDPELLLPRELHEFVALAKRTGIERKYRYKLAHQWLGRPAA